MEEDGFPPHSIMQIGEGKDPKNKELVTIM